MRFVCPECRIDVQPRDEGYHCPQCDRTFPILFGIPDFRIRPDRYLSLGDERAKAERLFRFGQHSTFDELVDYYYAITDDVPPELAKSFGDYVRNGPRRSTAVLDRMAGDQANGWLLDLGCGSGGALSAAHRRFAGQVGVDIGLRWLVICQKRLAEAGIDTPLVCADVEALPLMEAQFSHVLADDLIEHAYDPGSALAAAARQVAPGGRLLVSAINRHWLGPHPAVGIWGAGFMPAPLRSFVTRKARGVDGLRNMGFVSPASVIRSGRAAGLQTIMAQARPIEALDIARRSNAFRAAAAVHRWVASRAVLRHLLLLFGPTFEVLFRRPPQENTA